MTSSISSLFASPLSSTSSTSKVSADQLLLNQLEKQKSQSSSSDIFGSAVSLNLSPAAQNILNGGSGSDDGDALDSLLSSMTYSNHGKKSSSSNDTLDALLGLGANSNNSTNSADTEDAFVNGGGPLPAFLHLVDAQLHLDDKHAQALEDIAYQFRDAPKSQETVSAVAAALDAAGIKA